MSIARVRGPGHPDQVCDLVASAIVEEYTRRDPNAKLDIRVSGGHGALFVAGNVASTADFDVSAVVRRTLGQCGVSVTIEPFIALESMLPTWATSVGSRELSTVFGYATAETNDLFPPAISSARKAAQLIEEKRSIDTDWFWLGPDYEVIADHGQKQPLLIVRVEHVETHPLVQVRERLQELLIPNFPSYEIRVNPAGEESTAGLAQRVGSSRISSALDTYGTSLPQQASGAGYHGTHPLNVGGWLARSVARELVKGGEGKAVVVHVSWLPLEPRPRSAKARNERGQDLSPLIDLERFDLAKIPDLYRAPSLNTMAIRAVFDGEVSLPWEV